MKQKFVLFTFIIIFAMTACNKNTNPPTETTPQEAPRREYNPDPNRPPPQPNPDGSFG